MRAFKRRSSQPRVTATKIQEWRVLCFGAVGIFNIANINNVITGLDAFMNTAIETLNYSDQQSKYSGVAPKISFSTVG